MERDALILSLDSLSIYREIDIASAKPSSDELRSVPHFGIDILSPDEHFDVTRFVELYREVRKRSIEKGLPLIIVGGSSFYLKILLEGISPLPETDDDLQQELDAVMRELPSAYEMLRRADPDYARTIAPSDRYRIDKALQILLATGEGPSRYFNEHPPIPIITGDLPIFEIVRERENLRERIRKRTLKMIEDGLIDEVAALEARYSRKPSPMKAIGIREVLGYLDGDYRYDEMAQKIMTNTARLAKRQTTFNRSQFEGVIRGDEHRLRSKIGKYL